MHLGMSISLWLAMERGRTHAGKEMGLMSREDVVTAVSHLMIEALTIFLTMTSEDEKEVRDRNDDAFAAWLKTTGFKDSRETMQ